VLDQPGLALPPLPLSHRTNSRAGSRNQASRSATSVSRPVNGTSLERASNIRLGNSRIQSASGEVERECSSNKYTELPSPNTCMAASMTP
jgi:hypothetical protein